jgi:hypothetical protein
MGNRVKSIPRFIVALYIFSIPALIGNARAAGIIIEKEVLRSGSVYKVVPFTTEGGHDGFKSYFTDKNGKTLTIDNASIIKIVSFPDIQNLTDEATLTSLRAKKADLEHVSAEVPSTKPYIAPQVAAIERQITRFLSGERMVNREWFTGPEYQKMQADAKAYEEKRRAEAEAARERYLTELKAAEEKRIEEEKVAERERAEKARKAAEALKRLHERFEAAEEQAARDYERSARGTLSGQVFVSTRGGENFKLGAVQVALFARDAIDTLLTGLQAYMDEFNFGEKSGHFYFSHLGSPIETAETDADGKFVIEIPKTRAFVIAAQARRSVGDTTERYYWLQPVSLEGRQQRVQNLSNNNLTSTTGGPSLITHRGLRGS